MNYGRNCMGQEINILRKRHSMNQKEFAEFLKIPASRLNEYETGKRIPTLNQIEKICEVTYTNFMYNSGDYIRPYRFLDKEIKNYLHLKMNEGLKKTTIKLFSNANIQSYLSTKRKMFQKSSLEKWKNYRIEDNLIDIIVENLSYIFNELKDLKDLCLISDDGDTYDTIFWKSEDYIRLRYEWRSYELETRTKLSNFLNHIKYREFVNGLKTDIHEIVESVFSEIVGFVTTEFNDCEKNLFDTHIKLLDTSMTLMTDIAQNNKRITSLKELISIYGGTGRAPRGFNFFDDEYVHKNTSKGVVLMEPSKRFDSCEFEELLGSNKILSNRFISSLALDFDVETLLNMVQGTPNGVFNDKNCFNLLRIRSYSLFELSVASYWIRIVALSYVINAIEITHFKLDIPADKLLQSIMSEIDLAIDLENSVPSLSAVFEDLLMYNQTDVSEEMTTIDILKVLQDIKRLSN